MIRRLSDRFWNYLTDRIEARMHLRPDRDNTLDLGSSDYQWRRVYVGPGSAAAPAITLDGDTDTGIYQSAADNLDFATGGVRRLNISSAGLTVAGAIRGSTVIGARVYNSAAISIPNAVWTALTFDSERFDTDGIHSTSTNTARLTCVTAGKYLITGHIEWDANNTGARGLSVWHNNYGYIGFTRVGAVQTLSTLQSIAVIYDLAAGEYVELRCRQDTGGSLNVLAASAYSPEFAMVRIA